MLRADSTRRFRGRDVDTAFGTLVPVYPFARTYYDAICDHKLFAAMVAMVDFSREHTTLKWALAERTHVVID